MEFHVKALFLYFLPNHGTNVNSELNGIRVHGMNQEWTLFCSFDCTKTSRSIIFLLFESFHIQNRRTTVPLFIGGCLWNHLLETTTDLIISLAAFLRTVDGDLWADKIVRRQFLRRIMVVWEGFGKERKVKEENWKEGWAFIPLKRCSFLD